MTLVLIAVHVDLMRVMLKFYIIFWVVASLLYGIATFESCFITVYLCNLPSENFCVCPSTRKKLHNSLEVLEDVFVTCFGGFAYCFGGFFIV